MAVGAGMITTFTPSTSHAAWIGYPCLFGFGVGMGMQQALIAVQVVLSLTDIPTGTALVSFTQTLGAAVFLSVGQNIFTNNLLTNLRSVLPELDPSAILSGGATNLQGVVDERDLGGVVLAYNNALVDCFYVAVAAACLTIFGAAAMEWKTVKGKNIEMAAG